MKRNITILIILFVCFITGCKTKTIYYPVERKTTITETLRDTVIDVRLEHIRDSVITPDTTSRLSNKYAYSSARLISGMLHHTLSTWPDALIPVEVKYIDRLQIDSIPAPYPVEVPVYIDKEPTWWQKARMRLGEAFLVAITAALIYAAGKLIKRKFI